jgi:hypothetical protein
VKEYKLIIVSCLTFLINGCAQIQVQSWRAQCDFSNDQRFSALKGKVPLSPSESEGVPSLSELNNNNKATSTEIKVLYELNKLQTDCAREAQKIIAQHLPEAGGLIAEVYLGYQIQMKLLINNTITYAQYRQNNYEIYLNSQKVFAEYIKAKQQANATALQAASYQLNTTMAMLQAYNKQPTMTICNKFGTGFSCMTQ